MTIYGVQYKDRDLAHWSWATKKYDNSFAIYWELYHARRRVDEYTEMAIEARIVMISTDNKNIPLTY